jgi:two-component system capsular synthesis sensor histidine kinase RcsC
VKFTDTGGQVMLECGVQAASGSGAEARVFVRVTDTGIGMAAHDLERIFEPFVQVESGATHNTRGTGLGLAISSRFARLMGGQLTVASTPGKGSEFTLWLRPAGELRSESVKAAFNELRQPAADRIER